MNLARMLADVNAEFEVIEASTPALREDAFRLRYDVYCLERGFEASNSGLETDEFDKHSRHILLRGRGDGVVLGTARIVTAASQADSVSFPMQQVCDLALCPDLPVATTGEISRFAISKQRRLTRSASQFMRLGLVRGLVQASREAGVTHWCAVMEPSLLRLLRATGIHFQEVGPLVEFHGIRQPAVAELDLLLARMSREAPAVWEFVTAGGQFAEAALPLAA